MFADGKLIANIKNGDKYDVAVGRGTPFGNPFSHQYSKFSNIIKVATRTEAIERYREWLTSSDIKLIGWQKPTKYQVIALRGKVLGCWCHPLLCHSSVLIELAETWSKEAEVCE